jgi:N-methylhydantoinase A/oxoprolinase/acetone carboxylase beta subunit
MSLTVGIDIGGTFTDVVALDRDTHATHFTKVQSTPGDPSRAVVAGLEKILRIAGAHFTEVDRVVHSSTVSLNAILERKGARLGILATHGFGDLLVIGRQKRTDMYDLMMDAETPVFLCPRARIIGIPERLDPRGRVLRPLDEGAVEAAAIELVERHRVDAIAVCFLFSYLNPEHELRARAIVHRRYPTITMSLSSEVDPHFREYERLVMTTFDAYIKPVAEDYLRNLAGSLEQRGARAVLQIMQSRGGITGWEQAADRPVTTALSGPAAGVIGGSYSGRQAGFTNLITVDIGGTSCDICLVTEGKPLVSSEGKLDRYPLRQQMIDVTCIGAGGGSIAWIDEGRALRVGPQSAGATPGPACYGRGGTAPTITDASLALGYLNPREFGCGELALVPELAQEALQRLATQVGLGVPELALGMHRILNARMADAIRLVSIKRGFDTRRFGLLGLGGGGPVHAAALAHGLSCGCAIIPVLPGVLCATGLLAADIEHEQSKTLLCPAGETDPPQLEAVFAALLEACARRMRVDNADPAGARATRLIDARYAKQSYELELQVPDGPITHETLKRLVEGFHALHERVYGHAQRGQAVVFVTARAVLAFRLADPQFSGVVGAGTLEDARKGERPALFDLNAGFVPTPIYDRPRLPAETPLAGPAIIEQPDTTTLIYPGQTARVDRFGNIIIHTDGAGA